MSTRVTDASSGSTTTSPTTTSLPSDPGAAAIAAYTDGWKLIYAALNPANENYPGLTDAFTGAALGDALSIVGKRARTGGGVEGRMDNHATVVTVGAEEVVLNDCANEFSIEYDGAGNVVENDDGTLYHYRVTVVHESGRWRVERFEQLETAACAN